MAGAFASDTTKVGRARRARSMNRLAASYCDSAGTATIVSGGGADSEAPARSPRRGRRAARATSPARLTAACCARRAAVSDAHGSRRCSQLSRTSSVRPSASARDQLLDGCIPGDVVRAGRGQHRCSHLRLGSVTPASSTNQTPPGNCSRTSAATASASRVLPTPPDPVSVTSRSSRSELAERGDVVLPADQRRQLDGKVVTVRVERAQRRMRGGQLRVDDLPHALGTAEVLEPVHAEVSAGATSSGSWSTTSPAAASDTRIWSPWPIARRRAHRITV